jgi:hypothetical protein
MDKVERYINEEGKVGVLISGGYGAGWSTWADSKDREFMLFDRGLVALALDKEAAYKSRDSERISKHELDEQIDKSFVDVEEYLHANNRDPYIGGWAGVYVVWMDPGTEFIVEEYDGSESLRYRDKENWISA